jgi:hypothetical protein
LAEHLPDLERAAAARPPAVVALAALPVVVVRAEDLAAHRRAVVAAEAAAAAPRVHSGGLAARPDVDVSPRSNAAKSSIRWKRHQLVASASSRAMGRRFGSPAARL